MRAWSKLTIGTQSNQFRIEMGSSMWLDETDLTEEI